MTKKNCAEILAEEVQAAVASRTQIDGQDVNRAAERYLACEPRENPNLRAQPVLKAIRLLLKVREEL